jgi:hypothetical protein
MIALISSKGNNKKHPYTSVKLTFILSVYIWKYGIRCFSFSRSPKLPYGNCEYDGSKAEGFYKELFSDLSVDAVENKSILEFFEANTPPRGDLVALRATAFKAAVDYLGEDISTNVSLLKCINVTIHNLEQTVFK